jgi:hypothetical protein
MRYSVWFEGGEGSAERGEWRLENGECRPARRRGGAEKAIEGRRIKSRKVRKALTLNLFMST